MIHKMKTSEELIEMLAEAIHEIFCDSLRSQGYQYGPETNKKTKVHSSLKQYAELPEDEKEQNRNYARDIPNKLASVGYIIVPAHGNEATGEFREDEIERLAKMEHERWMRQKLNAGWKPAKRTNKAKKLHKDLIPWDRLPPYEQDKDRYLVRDIPKIIAKAGYTMVKAG